MKILHSLIALIITAAAWGQVWGEPFMDLENVDFGECDMAMGIGIVGGECVYISGCGWEVDEVDYSPAFYMSFDACESSCLGDVTGCTYEVALNYSSNANFDDGSCLFPECISECSGDVDGDESVIVEDILMLLANFGAICN